MAHISFLYHIIWRTKCSEPTITEAHERDFYAYVLGICNQKGCKLHRINSMPDHVHILISIRADIAVSEFMKVLKTESSKWMKQQREWFPHFRGWGDSYAGFTYAERDREMIRNYIIRQKEHHKRVSFREEYEAVMQEFGLDTATDQFLKD